MIEAMVDDASELISVYYGSDVTKEDAEEVTAAIAEKFENCDVELQDGGQPIYYFIVSVE
jgi:dihydroxyacetone kinase-like predicted kinase